MLSSRPEGKKKEISMQPGVAPAKWWLLPKGGSAFLKRVRPVVDKRWYSQGSTGNPYCSSFAQNWGLSRRLCQEKKVIKENALQTQ